MWFINQLEKDYVQTKCLSAPTLDWWRDLKSQSEMSDLSQRSCLIQFPSSGLLTFKMSG